MQMVAVSETFKCWFSYLCNEYSTVLQPQLHNIYNVVGVSLFSYVISFVKYYGFMCTLHTSVPVYVQWYRTKCARNLNRFEMSSFESSH